MKKTFLGVVLCAAALWGMQAVWASVRSVDTTSENLIPKSDFTEISSLGDYKQEPLAFNEWLMYHDASKDKDNNDVKIELVNDAARGQVLSFYGRPTSYYTSFAAQRIEGKMKKGIYRLTFWAKSDDGAKIKIFFNTTDAGNVDQNRYMVAKETPADETTNAYYGFYDQSLTPEWKQYSVEFNFAQVAKSLYSIPWTDTEESTADDLVNVVLKLQGGTALKTYLVDDLTLELIKDLSDPDEPEPTGENLIKMPGFDDADFSLSFTDAPNVYNKWVTDKDEVKDAAISFAVVDDAERGKVASYAGKPYTWYHTFFAQRIETQAKKGIYRLSFWGKSVDGGQVKTFFRLTDNGNKEQQRFFVKETGKPSSPDSKFYGSYYTQSLTAEWKQYFVDFDFTKVTKSMYQFTMNDTEDATTTDLTNFILMFQGNKAETTILIDDVELTLIKDLSDPDEPETPVGENLVKDSGFDATTTEDVTPTDGVWKTEVGIWSACRDEYETNQNIKISIKEDATQGKVLSYDGRPYSWYTTVVAQRIGGTLDKAIYRLSFKAKSSNAGVVRLYTRCTDEANEEFVNRYFVKANGAPADPDKTWRGVYEIVAVTGTWATYQVEYDVTQVSDTQYDMTFNKNVFVSTESERTNMAICFYNDKADSEILIDDVEWVKVSDVEDIPVIVKYDFEEAFVPTDWKAQGGELALSADHYTSGAQSLEWTVNENNAMVEFPLGSDGMKLTSRNAAFFNIYAPAVTGNVIYVDFLNAKGESVKKATLLQNFKGWREFNRPYDEYENTDDETAVRVRLTYSLKEGNTTGVKVYLDNMNLNNTVDGNRQYPEMLAKDVKFLDKANARLLGYYAYSEDVELSVPTTKELEGIEKLREATKRTPTANPGLVRQIKKEIDDLQMTRNADGTIKGKQIIAPKDVNATFLSDLSKKVKALAAAYIAGSPSWVVDAFPMWIDLIIDQGIFCHYKGFTWSAYSDVRDVPAGFLDAMNAYTDEQKTEICKAILWILEANQAYAPYETVVPGQSSDYVYNCIDNIITSFVQIPDDAEAVKGAKILKTLLENFSSYIPGGGDVLKPDGTGFHHNTHYNGYMYAYTTWVNALYTLKGTCYQVDLESYEHLKKAVTSMYFMATKGANHLCANSLAGRHPLLGGLGVPTAHGVLDQLIEIGGELKGTGIDTELASQYNYFTMTDKYKGVPVFNGEGFYQFNYSPIGVYRQDNWVATMRCPTTKFWGGEIYDKTNRYGRYQAHGSLEVMYDGERDLSGVPTNGKNGGWDWNVVPGATTVHYTSWKEMMPNKDLSSRFDQYSLTTNFAGALPWEDCGMFGAEFDQGDSWGSQRFVPTNLKFKKSVYAFDGLLISLGSDISANGEYGNDMITATNLFQTLDSPVQKQLLVNGTEMAAGSEPKSLASTESVRIVNPVGTGYIIPKGHDELVIKHGEQSSPEETGENLDNPAVVTAAKAYINHGIKTADKSYEFVVVPAVDDAGLAAIESKVNSGELYEVKAKNADMHVLNYKPRNVMAYTLFKAAADLNYGYVKAAGSEMLLMEQYKADEKILYLSVCNPNLRPKSDPVWGWSETETVTSLVVTGEWKLADEIEGVIATLPGDGTTQIDFTLAQGMPLYLRLIDKDATGIEAETENAGLKVYTVGKDVYVLNATGTMNLYDLTGRIVKTLESDGNTQFTVEEAGCYILKTNKETVKLLIK